MDISYPFQYHPCWSNSRDQIWERIHLPVAPECNVKCAFCNLNKATSCHVPIPGTSEMILNPSDAIDILSIELKRRENLRIAAISGPGDPLANEQTFETLGYIRKLYGNLRLCLCTNGVLLSDRLDLLLELSVDTITVSVITVRPTTASEIYEWAIFNGNTLTGFEMGEFIIKKQLCGISDASDAGIRVKTNTILIPQINGNEITEIAAAVSKSGASLQNIMPLVPSGKWSEMRRPTIMELSKARNDASKYLPQFHHCKQCRSDAVGIPENDCILRF